jgi:hypothetical protein
LTDAKKEASKEDILQALQEQEQAIDKLIADHKEAVKLLKDLDIPKPRTFVFSVLALLCEILAIVCLLCVLLPVLAFLCGILYSIFLSSTA